MVDFGSLQHKEKSLDFGTLKVKEYQNISRAHDNSPINLIRPGFVKTPFLDRISAFITHYVEIKRVIQEKEIDVIVLYSVPTNGLQTIKLAKKFGIPVVFRSIDVLHMLVMNKFLGPLVFALEKSVYKKVDRILALSPKLSDYVIRMGAEERKVELLLFGVDMNKFNPNIDYSQLKNNLRLKKNSKIILYVGTLFDFSGLDIYLKQFPSILKEHPETKLLIIGGGPLLNKLKNLTMKLNISENVVIPGFQPFNMMPQYINIADICINPFKLTNITRDIIPGKIIQYLSCGKPVLATPLPGMISRINGPDQGVIYSRISKFGEKTIELLNNKNKIKQIGKNGYLYVKKYHDEKEIARQLETILYKEISKKQNKEIN